MTPSPDPSVSERLRELREFLAGSGVIDGAWFGEFKPGERVPFWWRRRMRADLTDALAILDTQAAEIERLKAGLDREAVCRVDFEPDGWHVDDVAISGDLIRMFRLEMMDRDQCWANVSMKDGRDLRFWMDGAKARSLKVTAEWEGALPPSDEVKS